MSVDCHLVHRDGEWINISAQVWATGHLPSEFWVDLVEAYETSFGLDDRYYFPDHDSAIVFYLEALMKGGLIQIEVHPAISTEWLTRKRCKDTADVTVQEAAAKRAIRLVD